MRAPALLLLAVFVGSPGVAAAQHRGPVDVHVRPSSSPRSSALIVLSRREPPDALLTSEPLPSAVAPSWAAVVRARDALRAAVRASRAHGVATTAERARIEALDDAQTHAEEAALAALQPVERQLGGAGWLLDAELRWAHAARRHLAALEAQEAALQRGDEPGADPVFDAAPVLVATRDARAHCSPATASWAWARYLEAYVLAESGDDAGAALGWRDVASRPADAALAQEAAFRSGELAYDARDSAAAAASYTQAVAGPDATIASEARYRRAWSRFALGQLADARDDALAVLLSLPASTALGDDVSDGLRADLVPLAAFALDGLGEVRGASLPASLAADTAQRVLVELAAIRIEGGRSVAATTALDAAEARGPPTAELAQRIASLRAQISRQP